MEALLPGMSGGIAYGENGHILCLSRKREKTHRIYPGIAIRGSHHQSARWPAGDGGKGDRESEVVTQYAI